MIILVRNLYSVFVLKFSVVDCCRTNACGKVFRTMGPNGTPVQHSVIEDAMPC